MFLFSTTFSGLLLSGLPCTCKKITFINASKLQNIVGLFYQKELFDISRKTFYEWYFLKKQGNNFVIIVFYDVTLPSTRVYAFARW